MSSAGQHLTWKCGDRTLEPGGFPLIMGIVNVTPDSFSDGGQFSRAAGSCRARLETRRRRGGHSGYRWRINPAGSRTGVGDRRNSTRRRSHRRSPQQHRWTDLDRHHQSRSRPTGTGRRSRHRQRHFRPDVRSRNRQRLRRVRLRRHLHAYSGNPPNHAD